MDFKSIGIRVRYYRNKMGASQEELAYMAHISHVHVGYIERGERAPSLDVLISIANTLNVSSDDLLADNLLVSSTGISSSEIEILEDCSAEEAEILLQVMRRLKEIIRNYRISR